MAVGQWLGARLWNGPTRFSFSRDDVRGRSLRARLARLVIASTVPMVAFSLIYQYVEYRENIAAAGTHTLALARSMTQAVEVELGGRIAALQVLALAPALRAGDLDAFRATATAVVARQFP